MREIIHLQVGQCGNQVRGRWCVFDKIDRYQVLGGYQQGTDPRAAVLQSCALGYQWGTHFFTTPIGIIAHQYGIKADFNHSVKELYQIAGFNIIKSR